MVKETVRADVETHGFRRKIDGCLKIVHKPITTAIINKTRVQLMRQIRGTGLNSAVRAPPYHTYPPRSGNLETNSYVERMAGSAGISIGSHEPYASIMEFGRRPMWKIKHPFMFEGYYPNFALVRKFIKAARHTDAYAARISKEIEGEVAANRWNMGYRGTDKKTGRNNPWADMSSARKRSVARSAQRLAEQYSNRSIMKIPKGERVAVGVYDARKRKTGMIFKRAYPYGIYTIFAWRIKSIAPYRVFSNTAELAKETIEKDMALRVKKLNGAMI